MDLDGEAANDLSGSGIALSSCGDVVAIGASSNSSNAGHVRIYQWDGSVWTQKGADIDGEAVNDASGTAKSVSLSADGDRVAIGAGNNGDNGVWSGHVRVYQWNGSTWTQLGVDLDGEAAIDHSGAAVSLSDDGERVAIGAWGNDANGNASGQVRIYQWTGSNWIQLGADIDGANANDHLGVAVSLSYDGNKVAIGASQTSSLNPNISGYAQVFQWNGTAWVQLGGNIIGETLNDGSGSSVALSDDGDRLAIGAKFNSPSIPNQSQAGHVRVFEWSGTAWLQMGADIDGENAQDQTGREVAISGDGNLVAIPSIHNSDFASQAGHTRLYQWDGTSWTQLGMDIDGEAQNDQSGSSVALSGNGGRVAIGAIGNGGAGTYAGHARVFEINGPVSCCEAWTLTINTDGAGNETTWQLLDANTAAIFASGGPYANNVTIVENVCIPPGTCLDLVFNDAGSNGIYGGGWILADNNGNRVIDNYDNGSAFTDIAQPGIEFCSPVGAVGLVAADCDRMNWAVSESLECTPDAAVSAEWMVGTSQADDGYQFWFFDPTGGYDRWIFRKHSETGGFTPPSATRACNLFISAVSPFPVLYNTLLNVRVRPKVNGVFGDFGPACRFMMPKACLTTQLIDDTAHPDLSCNVTLTFGGTDKVTAYPIIGVTWYQFEFDDPLTGWTRRILNDPGTSARTLDWGPFPLAAGITYDVRVRVSFDGVTYCPWGASCPITISTVRTIATDALPTTDLTEENELTLFPNPSSGGQIALVLNLAESSSDVQSATADIFDVLGKRLVTRNISIQDGVINQQIELGGELPSGLYTVVVTAGDERFMEKLIIR